MIEMKRIFALIISSLLYFFPVDAQRLVDATDQSPISAASIFNAAGNLVSLTWSDGDFSDVPESVYPITICCIGYESLVLERLEDKVWEMTPKVYELDEVVVVPVKRNILKQTFYAREYFSINTQKDTITFFLEHMVDRFVPTSKDAKFGGNFSLRKLNSRCYSRYKILEKDSFAITSESSSSSVLSILELNNESIKAPESFKDQENRNKLYEKSGKSGMFLIQKQNAYTFTMIKDPLAEKKEHTVSPLIFKLLGFTMDFKQLYITQVYRTNDTGVYQPKDLIEAAFVMEADGRGKNFRKLFASDKPIAFRSMIELFLVDSDFYSKEEAKDEYKNKPTNVEFVIPSTIPPLNEVTLQLVERANAEAKVKNLEK